MVSAGFAVRSAYKMSITEDAWARSNGPLHRHVDDCLYTQPQYELVYTLDNTSDSRTEFRDAAGTVHSLWAEPNSLLIIRCAPPPELLLLSC